MIDATATLEHPGAIKVHVVLVAPTAATFTIYQAIAEAMKNPANGKINAEFKEGAIILDVELHTEILDVELHTEDHVDHLDALAEAAKNMGKSVVAAGEAAVEAVEAGAETVKEEVDNLAHAAMNEARKLTGHEGPGPNVDAGAEPNADPDALGKLHDALKQPGQVAGSPIQAPITTTLTPPAVAGAAPTPTEPTPTTPGDPAVENPTQTGQPSAEDLDKAAEEQRLADATAGLPTMDGADQPAK